MIKFDAVLRVCDKIRRAVLNEYDQEASKNENNGKNYGLARINW